MYAAERRRRILDMVRNEESVKVTDLADMFSVSSSTIRRDLNSLHRADLIERTYGGAVTSPLNRSEASFNERSISHCEEKDRIGLAAAKLLQPGETIMLDGGATTEHMARHLRKVPGITVVTFGVNIITALAGADQVTVIGIGGVLQHTTMLFGGVLAADALAAYNLRFDRAFLAATGVSAADGVTNFGFEEIPLKRQVINQARELILLADSSKVGARSAAFIAPANRIHRLITGSDAAPAQVEALRRMGILVDLV